jgi:hypothetical protein
MKVATLLSVAVYCLLMSNARGAEPYKWMLHPQCPNNTPNVVLWKDYMKAKDPAVANPRPDGPKILFSGSTSIEFREANRIADQSALPGIDPSACYSVTYSPGSGYDSSRAYNYGRNSGANGFQVMHALPGSPENYYINVGGTLLKYNEAGTVFDLRGRPAGVMLCYHTNNCEQYRYTDAAKALPLPERCPHTSWSEIATAITKDVANGLGADVFKHQFIDAKLDLACVLDPKLLVIARDIEAKFAKYFAKRDAESLNALFEKVEDSTQYAAEYSVSGFQSYEILASLWLAVGKERVLRGAVTSGSMAEIVKSLHWRATDLRGELADNIFDARYTKVERWGNGWSWVRKSDGIHHKPYKDYEEAFDVWNVDVGNAVGPIISSDPDILGLQKLKQLWRTIDDICPASLKGRSTYHGDDSIQYSHLCE